MLCQGARDYRGANRRFYGNPSLFGGFRRQEFYVTFNLSVSQISIISIISINCL